MARTAQQIVDQEVLVCTSSLIHMLAGGCAAITADNRDLVDLCEQAIELAAPIDDWEEAAREAGWRFDESSEFWFHPLDPNLGIWGSIQDVCDTYSIESNAREVFEHWAITKWLGEKLQAKGEKVDFDFAGMVIWARTTTGQAIAIDYIVEKIAEDIADA